MNYMKGLLMKPEQGSNILLGITRSKAKMYEYDVENEHHINITSDPSRLIVLTIGILGELSAQINSTVIDKERQKELKKDLQFSALFFDAYFNSKLNENIDSYLIICAASAYYLCDLPGSAIVLAESLNEKNINLECEHLDDFLLWILKGEYWLDFEPVVGRYHEFITELIFLLNKYYHTGEEPQRIINCLNKIRETAYFQGNSRELLFADVIGAITKTRLLNSTWYLLPMYTDLSIDDWRQALIKSGFVRELWPSQKLLGNADIFRGQSAIIQMPTSAGKTKSTEIIIRSAFLTNRASIVVVVAPFRALCNEIRASLAQAFYGENIRLDEVSDVPQFDLDTTSLIENINIENERTIIVLTPEKLLYILRQTNEFAENIGLLIYDEGHQFDNGSRGITYELLLASLKALIKPETQTILISAVISNADQVGGWLNGDTNTTVSGSNLLSTYRTIAFASWKDQLGRLQFVEPSNPEVNQYFVPRIMEQKELQLRGTETRRRYFPDKSDGKNIAIYLGVKLVCNGGIALFCGQKSSVLSMCKMAVDVFSRGVNNLPPKQFSDVKEVKKLTYLHLLNFGMDSPLTKCSELGIYAHSGNTPQGLRLAIEYAMQNELIKYIICTSTLAQGVNLPIRYLIVTSIYQAGEKIRVRDFHNLIGRAGRAGMYTEGSIIFADPMVYDKRKGSYLDRLRWERVKNILEPKNSEPCNSTIKSIFDNIYSDNRRTEKEFNALNFVEGYIQNYQRLSEYIDEITLWYTGNLFTRDKVNRQINIKVDIVGAIESYLLSHWHEFELGQEKEAIESLAIGTFAYYISDDLFGRTIIKIFQMLAENIEKNIVSPESKVVFGRTLLGLGRTIDIKQWIEKNVFELFSSNTNEEIIITMWPLLKDNIGNKTFKKISLDSACQELLFDWLMGKSYYELHKNINLTGAKYIAGSQERKITQEHVIDICDNAYSYDLTLILSAVSELYSLVLQNMLDDDQNSINVDDEKGKFDNVQKRIKYGLNSDVAVILFEIGFSDRVIASDLAKFLDVEDKPYKYTVIKSLKEKKEQMMVVIDQYPSYYNQVFQEVLDKE